MRERFLNVLARDDHALLVAELDGELAGYAWAQDHGPHLRTGRGIVRMNDLYVRPERRRRGIGRALFEAIDEWSRGRGVTWLQWQACRDSIAFYGGGAPGAAGRGPRYERSDYQRIGLRPSPADFDAHPFVELRLLP